LELGGKSPYIVFDDADLDSAVEGLVDAIWFNQGQVCCAGSRLLVQEGVAARFYTKLKRRMDGLRMGDPLDKCIDVGAIVDPVQLAAITAMMDANTEGQTYHAACAVPEGCFYPPTLVTGLSSASTLMQEEIFGPVLVSMTFRTPVEAVELANNTRYGLAATLWTENINLALDIAPKLRAGVVWVNGTNMFDAAACFGGVRESGFGREGGWEGLAAYVIPAGAAKLLKPLTAPLPVSEPASGLDRTAKLFIGGKQARPDGGYSRAVTGPRGKLLGHVGIGNRKDIRNAVEAAHAAKGWARTTGHNRAQILYYIAENLSARASEFAARLTDLTGKPGAAEVEASIQRLFTYAAWADKYDGAVKSVPIRGVAIAMNEPCGVIGALCPDEAPLLGAISLMAPAIAMGNTCVLVPSDPHPLAATDFYQVLETSDLPAGVLNIVTGSHADLAKPLAGHMDVDAVWYFGAAPLSGVVEREAATNIKRTWVNHGRSRDWLGAEGEGHAFLRAATEVKTIWVPYGE
jgi:aldehyde dehydrogenase (NAD+)